jgi:ferredoxin
MPTLTFEEDAQGPPVDVEGGARVLDVCDDIHAPIAFSCRAASCGVCRVEVLAGRELLEPARPDELEVLEIFAARPSERLACQAVTRAGTGRIHLRCVLAVR